jgi:hypothetical protein
MKNNTTTDSTTTTTTTPRLVGRPRASVKFPKAVFTRKQLYNMNRKLSNLTCINYLTAAVKGGIITRLAEKRLTGKAGKPQYKYVLTETTNNIPVVVETPIPAVEVPITVAEAPVVEVPAVVD